MDFEKILTLLDAPTRAAYEAEAKGDPDELRNLLTWSV
jgi:hypothetical protein